MRTRTVPSALGLAALAALSVAGCSSDDADTSSEAPEIEAEPLRSEQEEPTTDPVTVAEPVAIPDDPVELATAFWEAIAGGDRVAAVGLVDPEYVDYGAGNPFGRAQSLGDQFDWYEAVGWRWDFEGCAAGDTAAIECTATGSNAWSDALEVEPVTGDFLVSVGDEGVTAIGHARDRSFKSQWLPAVYDVFNGWVRTNHPDDARVMFDVSEDVDPEMLELYEINTERFVEAQSS